MYFSFFLCLVFVVLTLGLICLSFMQLLQQQQLLLWISRASAAATATAFFLPSRKIFVHAKNVNCHRSNSSGSSRGNIISKKQTINVAGALKYLGCYCRCSARSTLPKPQTQSPGLSGSLRLGSRVWKGSKKPRPWLKRSLPARRCCNVNATATVTNCNVAHLSSLAFVAA